MVDFVYPANVIPSILTISAYWTFVLFFILLLLFVSFFFAARKMEVIHKSQDEFTLWLTKQNKKLKTPDFY